MFPVPGFPSKPLVFEIPDWWKPVLVSLNCTTRILIVSDGAPRFGTGGFALSEAVDIIKAANTTDHPIEVTTANVVSDITADVDLFTFDGTHTVGGQNRSLRHYQEIWIFGFSGSDSGMSGSQLDALVDFMDGGGGVFCTGDHGNLGGELCGEIPRVKSMRHWYSADAPTQGGTTRLDTNVPSPGAEPDFDLQSDSIPQRIYPTWYGAVDAAVPHALLSFSGGTVTYLPDHPHEGRCVVPSPLDPAEWPEDSNGVQIPPEIVAHGVSAGPGFSGSKPSITPPELFGVIGAYDGHQTGVGRIVVDSTWHHWININLNGSGAGSLTGGVATGGLNDAAGNPTPEYLQIQAYFQNIAGWLEPRRLRICWMSRLIPVFRWEWPLVQELDPSRFRDLEHILEMGEIVEKLLVNYFGTAMVPELIGALADAIKKFDPQVRAIVDQFSRGKRRATPVTFDDGLLTKAMLGGAIIAFAEATPDSVDPAQAVTKLLGKKPTTDKIMKLLSSGAEQGLGALSEELAGSSRRFGQLAKALPKRTAD